jgi:large subunit ribosomal protein L30
MAKQIRIELVKGLAACLPKQRATVKALGLGKINSSVVKDDTPVTRGMVRVVEHLVKVEEI